jgi:hypothetical protein
MLPRRHDIMIASVKDEHGNDKWYHYLADHERRVIFWTSPIEVIEAREMLQDVPGAIEPSHIRESRSEKHHLRLTLRAELGWELESQYWWVCQLGLAEAH